MAFEPFVNFEQTSEERAEKYWLCRSLGVSASNCRRYRDWRMSKIERHFGLQPPHLQGRHPSTALKALRKHLKHLSAKVSHKGFSYAST